MPRAAESLTVDSARDVPPMAYATAISMSRLSAENFLGCVSVVDLMSSLITFEFCILLYYRLVIGYSCWTLAHRYSVVCTAGKGKEKVHQP